MKKLPRKIITRVLLYIRTLEGLAKEKRFLVSSKQLSEITGLSDVKIRKDISNFKKVGKPRGTRSAKRSKGSGSIRWSGRPRSLNGVMLISGSSRCRKNRARKSRIIWYYRGCIGSLISPLVRSASLRKCRSVISILRSNSCRFFAIRPSDSRSNGCHPRVGGDPESGFPIEAFGNDKT